MYSKKNFSTARSIFFSFSSLLSSPFPSHFPFRSHCLFFSFPFPFSFLRFFFKGAVCTVRSRDVRDGTAECNFFELIVSSLK